jgi:hypothetical protein
MALINRSDPVCWELMPLQGTAHWRSYIRNACQIDLPVVLLVQAVHKTGSSSQVHEEDYGVDHGEADAKGGDGAAIETEGEDGEEDDVTPFEVGGEIDEGGENEEVLRQYEMEVEGDELGLEEDTSDDEDEPLVPRDW